MSESRVTTIRLPVETADALDLIARLERTTSSALIKEAVERLIGGRTSDGLRERLRLRLAEDQKILDRLGGEPDAQ